MVSAGRSFGSCAMNLSTDICMETAGSRSPTRVRLVATVIGWLLQHAAVQPVALARCASGDVVEDVGAMGPEDLESVLVDARRLVNEVLAIPLDVLVRQAP